MIGIADDGHGSIWKARCSRVGSSQQVTKPKRVYSTLLNLPVSGKRFSCPEKVTKTKCNSVFFSIKSPLPATDDMALISERKPKQEEEGRLSENCCHI